MKKLCFLLCLLLSLSALVACSGEDDPADETSNSSTSEPEQKEGLTLSVSEETTLGVGQKITITAINAKTNTQTTAVSWTSDNTEVATVDYQGTVTAIADGTAVITATTIDGESASCTIKVASVLTDIKLSTNKLEINKGESHDLIVSFVPETFSGGNLVWISSDESVATVADGKVTAHKDGGTTIAVSCGEFTATCAVNVTTPVSSISISKKDTVQSITELQLVKGEAVELVTTVLPADATDKTIKWTSSDPAVVEVVDGKLNVKAGGTATVTASSVNGITAEVKITVSVPVTGVTLAPTSVTLDPGAIQKLDVQISPFDANDQTVIWESSNPAIATVSDQGVITAHKPGTAEIKVTTVQGYYEAICTVTVANSITGLSFDQKEGSLLIGQTLTLVPIKVPADADPTVYTWTSEKPEIASVDENGQITALTPGKTQITASTEKGASATYTLTVIDPATIEVPIDAISAEDTVVDAGETFELFVVVTPSNATEDYIVESLNPSIVVVNEDGTLTAIRKGTVQIKLSNKKGNVSYTCFVSVNGLSADKLAEKKLEYDAKLQTIENEHSQALISFDRTYDANIQKYTAMVNNATVTDATYASQKAQLEGEIAAASEANKPKLKAQLAQLEVDYAAYTSAQEKLKEAQDAKDKAIADEDKLYKQRLNALKTEYAFLFE